jgi:hypothetical protein
MNSSNDRPSRTLATLVAALGITVGVVPSTLHAQAATSLPDAVQQEGAAAVQKKDGVDKAALPRRGGVPIVGLRPAQSSWTLLVTNCTWLAPSIPFISTISGANGTSKYAGRDG